MAEARNATFGQRGRARRVAECIRAIEAHVGQIDAKARSLRQRQPDARPILGTDPNNEMQQARTERMQAFRRATAVIEGTLSDLATAATVRWENVESVKSLVSNDNPPDALRVGSTSASPFCVPLIGWGNVEIVYNRSSSLASAAEIALGLVCRALLTTPPGTLTIDIFDARTGGRAFQHLAELRESNIIGHFGGLSGDVGPILDQLLRHVESAIHTRINTTTSRLLVLVAPPRMSDLHLRKLATLSETGPPSGVSVLLVRADGEVPEGTVGESVQLLVDAGTAAVRGLGFTTGVSFDHGPTDHQARELAQAINDAVTTATHVRHLGFGNIVSSPQWTKDSTNGLSAVVGDNHGTPISVPFNDTNPHGLLCGPTGTGKTVLLRTLIGALAWEYSPNDLEMYLLDYKAGTEFLRYAPSEHSDSWLPHASIVGLNGDREFGLAVLEYAIHKMDERSAAERKYGVNNLSKLRGKDPDGHWPRILLVMDEFQILLGEDDSIASKAVDALIKLAKQGRSHGIHLLLSTQNMSGISYKLQAAKATLVEQLTLRIALRQARDVLSIDNRRAEVLPKFYAIVNTVSGADDASGNQIVHVATEDEYAEEQAVKATHDAWTGLGHPRLFDGEVTATPFAALEGLGISSGSPIGVLVGEPIAVDPAPVTFNLERSLGRHLAIIGTKIAPMTALWTAATSAVAQLQPGTATVHIFPLAPDSQSVAENIRVLARSMDCLADIHTASDLEETLDLIKATQDKQHQLVIIFGADMLKPHLNETGSDKKKLNDKFEDLLRNGPDRGTHVLGWWRTIGSMNAVATSKTRDHISGWLIFNAARNDLNALSVTTFLKYEPRENRATWYERGESADTTTVVPYTAPVVER